MAETRQIAAILVADMVGGRGGGARPVRNLRPMRRAGRAQWSAARQLFPRGQRRHRRRISSRRRSPFVVPLGTSCVRRQSPNLPGVWGGALFLVLLLTMLNTFGVSAGVRLLATGLIIVAVIAAAGGEKRPR